MDLNDHVRRAEQRLAGEQWEIRSKAQAESDRAAYRQHSSVRAGKLASQFLDVVLNLQVQGLPVVVRGSVLAPYERKMPILLGTGSRRGELREGRPVKESAWIIGKIRSSGVRGYCVGFDLHLAVLAGLCSPRIAFGEFARNDPCLQSFSPHHLEGVAPDRLHIFDYPVGAPYFLYEREVSVEEYLIPRSFESSPDWNAGPVMGRDGRDAWEFPIAEAMGYAIAQMKAGEYLNLAKVPTDQATFY